MAKIETYILSLCILCLMANPASATKSLPYLTFAGTTPPGYDDIGILSAGARIRVVVTWYSQYQGYGGLAVVTNGVPTTISVTSQIVGSTSSF